MVNHSNKYNHHFEIVAIAGTIIPNNTGSNASNCSRNVSSSKTVDYSGYCVDTFNLRIKQLDQGKANSYRKRPVVNFKISHISDQFDARISDPNYIKLRFTFREVAKGS
jgi:hypothetical protein